MGSYKYRKYGAKPCIDGIFVTKTMILQIGKEDKTQELSENDIEAIKALPHFKMLLERKARRDKVEAEWRKMKDEDFRSEINYSESCKKDLVDYLPVLKKLSDELGIKSVFFDCIQHPEGCWCSTHVDIEKLCKYAGKKVMELLTKELIDCYIEVTGGFDEANEQYHCADAMRDIYGFKDEISRKGDYI